MTSNKLENFAASVWLIQLKTHFMFNKFFSKDRDVYKMEKYCRIGNATEDNIIQRMRLACWITKARNTHSEYVIRTAFARQICYRYAPQYYVIRSLTVSILSLRSCVS